MSKMVIDPKSKQASIEKMSVKGGSLPKGFEIKLDVVIDFSTTKTADVLKYAAGGQSARVALQVELRKLTTEKLNKLAKEGLVVKAERIGPDFLLSPMDVAAKQVAAMSKEEKTALRKLLEKDSK